MNPFVLLFFAIMCETVGTTSLKMSDGFSKFWPSLLVVLGYGGAFYLMSLTLKQIPIGTSYAIWAGVGTAATVLIGVLVWHEKLNGWSIAGLGMIIVGVVLLNLFGEAHAA